ncbi:MAG: RluA family pseudouridine synthase [Patescibacteria group bacterium]
MKLNIVYEDADLLVLNKPSGISMHKTHINDQHETIADLLIKQYPFLKDVGEDLLRPGIVHRLDKETSGLVIIAKNNPTFSYLKNLFQERKMIKHYVALVYGHPHNPEGIINVPLGKLGTKQTTQLKGKKDLTVRDAITEYRTLKTFKDYTLLEVSPKTGRTHQIRIHLKSIGNPIVGDPLYAEGKPLPAGLDRLFLHAQRIEFVTPEGKALVLEAGLPEDLSQALEDLSRTK